MNIDELLPKIKGKIPKQGPLDHFVHHNTLHHYEDLNFYDATIKASYEYNAMAFMPESYYQDAYVSGRISKDNLLKSIIDYNEVKNYLLDENLVLNLLVMNDEDKIENTIAVERMQSKYLRAVNNFYTDSIIEKYGVDIRMYAQPLMNKFLSTYYDFGSAYWLLENRKEGLLKRFTFLYSKASFIDNHFHKNISKVINNLRALNPKHIIEQILDELHIERHDVEDFLFQLCLKHRGWTGFVAYLSDHAEVIANQDIVANFDELIAVYLIVELAAIRLFNPVKLQTKKISQVPMHSKSFINKYLYLLEFGSIEGDSNEMLNVLDDMTRLAIWHQAFEMGFNDTVLETVSKSSEMYHTTANIQPAFQVICCIDEREESFRRYLELNSYCETFGTAGHFGLNIAYKGLYDKHYRALCPAITKPEYKIYEEAIQIKKSRYRGLVFYGELLWLSSISSKTIIRGYIHSFLSPLINIVPFLLDIFSPSVSYKIKRFLTKSIKAITQTRLVYMRSQNREVGIPKEERVKLAAQLIHSIGINKQFADYVFIVGHGSSSLNNPHEAAHDCGACSGGRGGPNARLIANILNEDHIRQILKNEYHISIPNNTCFIGTYHNTCNDEVEFYDVNESNDALAEHCQFIIKSAALSAMERCRRFNSAALKKSEDYYLRHVQARSVDLKQPRPEYGHATNAICVIGPRAYTRHAFFDRRAFLVSYESSQDHDGSILSSIANGAIPVCAGINLEYYFSYIDNEYYGCGTKLPHNVTGLHSVINGYSSDLQLGLPWQMVEIHEPVKLSVVIYCTEFQIKKAFEASCEFKRLADNSWINLSIYDPKSNQIKKYLNNEFVDFTPQGTIPIYHRIDDAILNSRQMCRLGVIS